VSAEATEQADPLQLVLDAVEALDLRYHLGGSYASTIHGVPRQTLDADLVVDLPLGAVAALADRLRSRFYLDEERMRHAVERKVPVKSPEDTVLRKLQWYQDGGEVSDRQWNDVLGILKVQGDRLDGAYLERWAGRLGVEGLLRKARNDLA
jgi:hypothetical protein